MEKVTVKLGERSYDILIGSGLLPKVGSLMSRMGLGRRAMIVTNPGIADLYASLLLDSLRESGFSPFVEEIPDGEESKSLHIVSRLYDRLIVRGMDRNSPIIALGGGVIGDLAGFAAATFMRGVPLIQVPTTLLAQVDSSVGGKTAVNHPAGKNLIGAFYQPRAVFIDTDTLRTLPPRELLCGLAEVIKYGAIMDEDLFRFLEHHMGSILKLDGEKIGRVVKTSCAHKAEIVERDERDSEIRMILNFGHTLGHALESLADYKGLKHGEAVAIGMMAAARLSQGVGTCREEEVERICILLQRAGFPSFVPIASSDEVIACMKRDKKVRDERIRFVLLNGIGRAYVHEGIPLDLLRKVLEAPIP